MLPVGNINAIKRINTMNSNNLSLYLEGMAAVARVEAMKAQNQHDAADNAYPSYTDSDFRNEADALSQCASGVTHD